jgi:2-dehydro-3-deoxyphosphogalactonate aldolase
MTSAVTRFEARLRKMPLVAILRGVRPEESIAIGQALVDAGFCLIEVPLNSTEPLRSIEALARRFPGAMVGAGTVLSAEGVTRVRDSGGELIVAPNFNPDVVVRAVDLGMVCLPGVMTPTEAFAALSVGANGLKLFPAELIGPEGVKALRAVLPTGALMLPVGGVTPANMATFWKAGAAGFGIGSALYKPGMTPADVGAMARTFADALLLARG